jgi:hypothetical protein
MEWEEWAAEIGGGTDYGGGGGVGSVLAAAARDLVVNLRTPTFFLAMISWV